MATIIPNEKELLESFKTHFKEHPEILFKIQEMDLRLITKMIEKMSDLGVYHEFKRELEESELDLFCYFNLLKEAKPKEIKGEW